MSNHSYEVTGGSGCMYHAVIQLPSAGVYKITTSRGGTSRRSWGAVSGTDATPFVITQNGVEMLKITGGGHAEIYSSSGGGLPGTWGQVEFIKFPIHVAYSNVPGRSGSVAGKGGYLDGTPGPVAGHTWGQSGWSGTGYIGGSVGPSYNGYAKIRYIGPFPDESSSQNLESFVDAVNLFIKV